jgi:hypothetical protein
MLRSLRFLLVDTEGLGQKDAKGTKVFSKRIRVQTLTRELAGRDAAAYTPLAVDEGS